MVSQYPNATLVTASHATELQNWPGTCDELRACQTMPVRSSENTGEDLACAELARRGYAILDRRYRTRFGEIDIVASQDGRDRCSSK